MSLAGGVRTICPEDSTEAADVLARVMPDGPLERWLIPDPGESLAFHRAVFIQLLKQAQASGCTHVWGDPIVGVALWLERPAISAAEGMSPDGDLRRSIGLSTSARDRLAHYTKVMQRSRERARPDRHAYLDSLAVLSKHRHQGIAGRLLDAGHGWASSLGLPCCLETETDLNVSFYTKRGYRAVASVPLPEAGLTITSMRRKPEPRDQIVC